MSLFSNVKYLIEGIHQANCELVSGVKEVGAEFKSDMIDVVKQHNPTIGDKIEKADRLWTTYKNAEENIPTSRPINPKIEINKILKKAKAHVSDTDKLKRAIHVKVYRSGYSHHALTLGDGNIIHYSEGIIQVQSIENFSKGSPIYTVDTPRTRSKDKVIQRAFSRIGENEYNLLFNNCQHFVEWTLNGA